MVENWKNFRMPLGAYLPWVSKMGCRRLQAPVSQISFYHVEEREPEMGNVSCKELLQTELNTCKNVLHCLLRDCFQQCPRCQFPLHWTKPKVQKEYRLLLWICSIFHGEFKNINKNENVLHMKQMILAPEKIKAKHTWASVQQNCLCNLGDRPIGNL